MSLGMVLHNHNSVLKWLRQEDGECKASLGYIARLCVRKEKNKTNTSYERIISGPWESLPF
jgi:hypothetical protein